MDSNSIPELLGKLLTQLKFLSQIEKGQKPCMNSMSFVDAKSWKGTFIRFFTNEDRHEMMIKISSIIKQTIDDLEKYKNDRFHPIILRSLREARPGISNLADTYSKYPKTLSEIGVCLENIDLQLNEITSNNHRSLPHRIPTREEYEDCPLRTPDD